ncbi:aminoglycoside phosphotransferase family protein [Candidatus Symbiobacter mobilis]|uniref:Kinase-like protein n=1 Tax=Candidatus Symbiobacter mobilis CR TaxID=946483 RepID=U5N5F4_9BURK|nr:phosphotransferase [Candidatus Symbiobacter mobilis]AGX86746.1 kinase-like protein [Candidatus Symbiobacter mobilis CR]
MSTAHGEGAPHCIDWPSAQRQSAFLAWLQSLPAALGLEPASLRMASADASFRRYFRIDAAQTSYIVMDAPPDREDCAPFVQVEQLMREAGLRVPQVLDWDRTHGFLLLSDLGTTTMMQALDTQQPDRNVWMYDRAIDALIAWQCASRSGVLPPYDRAYLHRELSLFPDWYLARHRQIVLDDAQRNALHAMFDAIVTENLSWPSVYVHRDFMPRNLMLPGDTDERLGVLDFQDAMHGPIVYDIASLVRDAFLSWDDAFCVDIVRRYWLTARQHGLPVGDDVDAFDRGVRWMGLQRHLKVAGIFARLTLRDGKPRYLADTPRFIAYIRDTCRRYRELDTLLRCIDEWEQRAVNEARHRDEWRACPPLGQRHRPAPSR